MRFPGFRWAWKRKPIRDIAEVIGGGTPDTSVKSFWDGGIRWFTPAEIGKEKFISSSARTISEEGLKNSAARLLPPLSLLVNSRATIGACSISIVECAVSQGCHGLIAGSGCNLDFLYCLIQKLRKEILKKACGSAFREISAKAIRNMTVYVPKTQEQRKIAIFFSLLDKRIATQNKIIEDYKALIGGIGNRLSETGDTSVRLCDILEERKEKTARNNQYDVLSSTVDGLFRQRDYFSRDMSSTDNTGYKIVRMNDVVLCPQNLWMGNINYNDKFETGMVSPSYRVYSVSPQFDKEYVAALLKARRTLHWFATASGQGASTVRRNLDIKAFRRIMFKVPPYEVQVKTGKAISSLQKSLELAISLRDAYVEQKRYFMGKMFI